MKGDGNKLLYGEHHASVTVMDISSMKTVHTLDASNYFDLVDFDFNADMVAVVAHESSANYYHPIGHTVFAAFKYKV